MATGWGFKDIFTMLGMGLGIFALIFAVGYGLGYMVFNYNLVPV